MQDIIFLEFNSAFSHACEIGASCVSWSVVRDSAAECVPSAALGDAGDGYCFTLHPYQMGVLRGAQGRAVHSGHARGTGLSNLWEISNTLKAETQIDCIERGQLNDPRCNRRATEATGGFGGLI